MHRTSLWITRALILLLSFSLSGGPQLAWAQSDASQGAGTGQAQSSDQRPNQGTVNPSQGPLQPVPLEQTTPDTSQQNEAGAPEAPAPQKQNEHPLGAAVGEAGATTGGAASKPAGNAIAPAKQRQVRSLFLKVGAVAAAAVAVGTVYALTRSTPSLPPGAKTAGGIRK